MLQQSETEDAIEERSGSKNPQVALRALRLAHLTTILIQMATSIVFHENKKVNLVMEVYNKLCAITLEVHKLSAT